MDDILLADSDSYLERMFEKVKKILHCWGFQIVLEKNTKRELH